MQVLHQVLIFLEKIAACCKQGIVPAAWANLIKLQPERLYREYKACHFVLHAGMGTPSCEDGSAVTSADCYCCLVKRQELEKKKEERKDTLSCAALSRTNHIQTRSIHPSVHFLHPFNPIQGHGWVGAYPSCHQARGRVHPGQVTSPSQGHIETNRTNNHAYSHSLLKTI